MKLKDQIRKKDLIIEKLNAMRMDIKKVRDGILCCCGLYFLGFVLIPVCVNAQVRKSVETTVDIKKEQAMIPGKTMGQKLESLLFWTEAEKEKRFPIMQKLFPSLEVPAGGVVDVLAKGKPIVPQWINGTTTDSYMQDNHIAGMIVVQNNQIRLEKYGANVNEHTVWTSFSMAKSVSSMLLGAALKDGYIKSLDDPLNKYIPEFKTADYGKVTVRQLLTMTSGIGWNEDYENHQSDVAQMYLQPCQGSEPHILTYMKNLKFVAKPGTIWNYSTGETDLLGILIQKATGKSLAAYLSEKIWKPWGMQQKAYWLADECSDLNIGGSGLSATLRDYARLGSVMLNQGNHQGKSIFSREWMDQATASLYKTGEGDGGYGYLWWRSPNGSYRAVGIFGQMIYINPKLNLVVAQIAAWPRATSPELTKGRQAFIDAVEHALE